MTLDALQRLMRGFRRLAPYNAAQVVELDEPVDVTGWERAAEDVVLETGLGRPVFSAGERQVRFEPVPFTGVANVTEDLATHLASELNAPFPDDALPLRFFALGRHAGVVYDHWIADSHAIRALLERIHSRLDRRPFPDGRQPAEADRSGPATGARSWISFLLGPVRDLLRHRHAFRISLADPLDFRTGVLLLGLPEGLTESLRARGRALGATVHDLLLFALARAISSTTDVVREPSEKRKDLALGTIVDLRDPGDDTFGMRLGSFTTIHRRRADGELDAVAEITRQSRAGKRHARESASPFEAAHFFWRLTLSDRDRALLFHRNAPVAAGISNVLVTESRAGIRGHLTVSPAGPLASLVVTPTTAGPRTNLCVTYRVTAWSEETVARIADDFVRQLSVIALPGSPSSRSGR